MSSCTDPICPPEPSAADTPRRIVLPAGEYFTADSGAFELQRSAFPMMDLVQESAGVACLLQYWPLSDQLHHAEIEDLETVECLLYFAPNGGLVLREDYHSHSQSRLLLDRYMEVLSPTGEVLFRNDRLRDMYLEGAPTPHEGEVGYVPRRTRLANGTPVLAISHLHFLDGKPLVIRLAYSIEPLRSRLLEFVGLLLLAMPLALIAAAFAGYRVADKALNPLEQMARPTELITARRRNDRIPVDDPYDELGHMARVLNELLARLGESFEKLQHFT